MRLAICDPTNIFPSQLRFFSVYDLLWVGVRHPHAAAETCALGGIIAQGIDHPRGAQESIMRSLQASDDSGAASMKTLLPYTVQGISKHKRPSTLFECTARPKRRAAWQAHRNDPTDSNAYAGVYKSGGAIGLVFLFLSSHRNVLGITCTIPS